MCSLFSQKNRIYSFYIIGGSLIKLVYWGEGEEKSSTEVEELLHV